jgi:hypothetical protein
VGKWGCVGNDIWGFGGVALGEMKVDCMVAREMREGKRRGV